MASLEENVVFIFPMDRHYLLLHGVRFMVGVAIHPAAIVRGITKRI